MRMFVQTVSALSSPRVRSQQGVRANVGTLLADVGQVKSGVGTQEEVLAHQVLAHRKRCWHTHIQYIYMYMYICIIPYTSIYTLLYILFL